MGKRGKPFLGNKEPLIDMGYSEDAINKILRIKKEREGCSFNSELKDSIKRVLRVIDEQDYINKGKWTNLPLDMTSNDLMSRLYYEGQLMFFYDEISDDFYMLPYTLDGGLDMQGRYNGVHPIPYCTTEEYKKSNGYKQQLTYLSTLKRQPIYSFEQAMKIIDKCETVEELIELPKKYCVLLKDRCPQRDYNSTISRQVLNDGIIDLESDILPMLKTNLISTSGVRGVRVGEGESEKVLQANDLIRQAALVGLSLIPIEGNMEYQELADVNASKTQDYLMTLQGIDNFRLSTHGLEQGGVFEKKAHTLESEQAMNACNTGLVMQDTISIFQEFCRIVNVIFLQTIWYEPSENIVGDTNMNGVCYDEAGGSNNEQQTVESEGESNE